MKVSEMIELLKKAPQDSELAIDYGVSIKSEYTMEHKIHTFHSAAIGGEITVIFSPKDGL